MPSTPSYSIFGALQRSKPSAPEHRARPMPHYQSSLTLCDWPYVDCSECERARSREPRREQVWKRMWGSSIKFLCAPPNCTRMQSRLPRNIVPHCSTAPVTRFHRSAPCVSSASGTTCVGVGSIVFGTRGVMYVVCIYSLYMYVCMYIYIYICNCISGMKCDAITWS